MIRESPIVTIIYYLYRFLRAAEAQVEAYIEINDERSVRMIIYGNYDNYWMVYCFSYVSSSSRGGAEVCPWVGLNTTIHAVVRIKFNMLLHLIIMRIEVLL